MQTSQRVFVGRIDGLSVFDPLGDQVGRVRDVIVTFGTGFRRPPRAIGLVVEVPGKRRVFVPMSRVTSIASGQVITTGLVNMRRFEKRRNETLVVGELFDRRVSVARRQDDEPFDGIVQDLAIELQRNRDWAVTRVHVRKAGEEQRSTFRLRRRRGETFTVDIEEVSGLQRMEHGQGADHLVEAFSELKPADMAEEFLELTPKRRHEVADAMDDEMLADLIEELPDDDQVDVLSNLATRRAATILEAMEPDDATDLLSELPDSSREQLLGLMEPDEAAPLRRLLRYEDDTAGGMMTSEPVILTADTPVAEALARVRREELTATLASTVFVVRAPDQTPTGKFLGIVHFQRLLREPPHEHVGSFLDTDIETIAPEAPLGAVARVMAAYNLMTVPVCDEAQRLLGAVSVDDVLDHMLPDDWREERHQEEDDDE